jgi:hypothetical protein
MARRNDSASRSVDNASSEPRISPRIAGKASSKTEKMIRESTEEDLVCCLLLYSSPLSGSADEVDWLAPRERSTERDSFSSGETRRVYAVSATTDQPKCGGMYASRRATVYWMQRPAIRTASLGLLARQRRDAGKWFIHITARRSSKTAGGIA